MKHPISVSTKPAAGHYRPRQAFELADEVVLITPADHAIHDPLAPASYVESLADAGLLIGRQFTPRQFHGRNLFKLTFAFYIRTRIINP